MKKTKSWGLIVVLLIIFWPVGLYFLIQKLRYDKSATFKSAIALKVVAVFLILVGIAGFSSVFSGTLTTTVNGVDVPAPTSSYVIGFILAVALVTGGVMVFLKANKVVSDGKLYKQYINLVINSQITSISEIARILQVSPDKVKADLEGMIEKGIFQNAYIDNSTREIVLSQVQYNVETGQSLSRKTIVCPACGAQSEITDGIASKCEYCGTILK